MGLHLCTCTVHTALIDSDQESCPLLVHGTPIEEFQNTRPLGCWHSLPHGAHPQGQGRGLHTWDGLCTLGFFLRREACFGKPSTHHAPHRSPQENLYGARDCPHGLCGAQPFTHTAAEIKPPLCSFYLIQGTRGAAVTRKAASLLMNRAPSIIMAKKVL